MTGADRVLEPLREARASVAALTDYASPAELAAALRDVRGAAERSLRRLLRESPAAPDPARMAALAADYPFTDVVAALRRAELISLELAGELHALAAAADRSAEADPRATDADVAAAAVLRLEREVGRAMRAGEPPAAEEALAAADSDAETTARPVEDGATAPSSHRPGAPLRGPLRTVGLVVVLGVALVIAVKLYGGGDTAMAEGIAAFREDRLGVAEQAFRSVVEDDEQNVTAWLYLGRITRVQGRRAEAADALERAAGLAPDDAAVQRELGYLFLDLGQPAQAATRFDRARQLAPDDAAAWIGFIRALRAARDPQAEVWLERAPADVKAALGGTTITTTP